MIWQQVLKFKNIKIKKKKKKFVLPTVWKDIIKCDIIYYQKTLKYFKDLKNRHFWVLWLKWNQAMEMIQNQTYIFLSKYIILKYFNDFQNRNLSVLWLKWTQTMEIKQNQTFFHGTYSNLALFSLAVKYLNISKTFIIDTFQSLCKSEHNQVKWNYTGHVQIWLYFLFTK